MNYYTGVIFEAVTSDNGDVGSVAGGGRYDNLVGGLQTNGLQVSLCARVRLPFGCAKAVCVVCENKVCK